MMQFPKMYGLGSDPMIIDVVAQDVFFSPELVRRLANRHSGARFDQLLVVEPPYDPDLGSHYRAFNTDGNRVSRCGNDARCFAHSVRLKGLTNKRDIRVSTASRRTVLGVTEDDLMRVNMDEPSFKPSWVSFRINKTEEAYIVRAVEQIVLCGVASIGNPHCVIQVDDVDTTTVEALGPAMEGHEYFPERVSIGFMQVASRSRIRLHVYEHDAGEVQAYGSGACAVVVVGIQRGLLAETVRAELPSGHPDVVWRGPDQPPFMTDPAAHVHDGFTHLWSQSGENNKRLPVR